MLRFKNDIHINLNK